MLCTFDSSKAGFKIHSFSFIQVCTTTSAPALAATSAILFELPSSKTITLSAYRLASKTMLPTDASSSEPKVFANQRDCFLKVGIKKS